MIRRCLIVDPSAMVRRVAARIIRDMSFETLEAQSGQEALDLCAGSLPDVILVETTLPDMTSPELMRQIFETADTTGVARPTLLICTADRSVDQIVRVLKAGADEYIMKPFDSDIITAKFALAGLVRDEIAA